MTNITSLHYVERALLTAQKTYKQVNDGNPASPLLQMYDSIVKQLIFLKGIITGQEKDKSKLWKMTFGMYAAKEFESSDEIFFERLTDAWFIVDQIRRGLKVRLPHEVNENYSKNQKRLKERYPEDYIFCK